MTAGEARESVPRTPNSVLRGIRENERHETRSAFAEAMAQAARETGEEIYPDAKYVQRLESGAIAWPRPSYRNILVKLCGRPIGQLGFTAPVLSIPDSGNADDATSPAANIPLRDAIFANGMEVTEFARKVGVDPKTAQRWITKGRIPHPSHRWKACQILGNDESQLWPDAVSGRNDPETNVASDEVFSPQWTADGTLLAVRELSEVNPMDRRSFVFLAGAAITSSAHDWLIARPVNNVSNSTGRTIGPKVMDDLDDMTGKLRHMDDQMGGGSLIDMISAQARYIAALLRDGKYTDSIGRRLHGTLGELLRLGGWVSFDSGRQGQAQRFWLASLHATHTAGDNALGANVLGFMSEQAWSLGKLDDAARLAGTAVSGYKGSSPRVSAILHMRAARSQAMLDDSPGCRSNIDSAYDALRNSPSESGEPDWSYWMDEASLNEQVGKCFLYLKDYSAARSYLEMALQTEGFANYYRDGVSVLIALANAHAGAGEPEESCAVGTRAIDALSGRVDSPRLAVKIKSLREVLRAYEQVPAVQEFSDRVNQFSA
jgi:transcriptional regulator with XRE-family HTH domain